MTIDQIRTALQVLTTLAEFSTDGRLRDEIASVRTALWDELDRMESES